MNAANADLNANPPLTIDARSALEDLAADATNADTVLRPIITDLKAHPPQIGDAAARIRLIQTFLPLSPDDCVVSFAAAKEKLNNVYASPAFASLDQQQNDFFRQLGEKIQDFFRSLFSSLGTAGSVVVLAVLAAILLTVLYFAWRRMSGARKVERETGEPAATSDPDFEWKMAEAAAARGDYREAVRRAFRSALLHVAFRGRLRVDPAWTNRELLARASGDAILLTSLAPAAHVFENCWYGNEVATKQTWETARQRCLAVISLSRKQVPVP